MPASDRPAEGAQGAAARRFVLEGRWPAFVLAMVVAVSGWAVSSADPDFPLPDPFHPMILVAIVLLLASGVVRRQRLRVAVQIAVLLPMLGILALELHGRYRPLHGVSRAMRSPDRILRYHYRPGYDIGRVDPTGPRVINHLGLFDHEYVIPKPAGVYRIAILSGSVANDVAVPYVKRFHALVETHLARALGEGRRVEVLNVSCEGYNTLEQVRLLEKVGLSYDPDLVVVAHMLTGASLQDGSGRRFGNAYFAGRLYPVISRLRHGSVCKMVAPFYDGYSFDLIVRHSLERLRMLASLHGFDVLVASLPAVERFDDPTCLRMYDQVADVGRELGFHTVRVVEAFEGESFTDFAKPNAQWDFCHPNADGHARYAAALEGAIRPLLPVATPAR